MKILITPAERIALEKSIVRWEKRAKNEIDWASCQLCETSMQLARKVSPPVDMCRVCPLGITAKRKTTSQTCTDSWQQWMQADYMSKNGRNSAKRLVRELKTALTNSEVISVKEMTTLLKKEFPYDRADR